jgi:hypothetical protein
MFLCTIAQRVAGGLLACALSASAQTAHVPLSTWTDSSTGVSFQYPVVWQKVAKPEAMTPPMLFEKGLQPLVDVEFSPKGNVYEKTNLVGLDFLYATTPSATVEACYRLGEAESGDAKKERVTLNGVEYQHAAGGGAATCHEISYDLYSTYRAGMCHLFEEDFMTVCAGVVDGTRGLTPAETKALQGHLDAVMQSVRFSAPQ